MDIKAYNVDESRWDDLVELFGPSGTQRGCWCMFWRLANRDFVKNGNAENRAALREEVACGRPTGLLGYLDGAPVGWCSLSPRPSYQRVLRSKYLQPDEPEDRSVWSVPCFFSRRDTRGSGIAGAMLEAAVAHARDRGASVLEGYPVDTEDGTRKGDIHSGTIGLFTRAGFAMHRRPPEGSRRVVMRKTL
ncbi:MAG TPA: GNAT family N-acetyltransferase [Glycomyces sp.]|nr:GNAT family N-acetyltransferase [Glycomyces sp.]